jgi:tetratricopeptide (TPR) repeat protein
MESIPDLWNQAQQLEAVAKADEARSIYLAILDRESHHVPARLRMSRLEQLSDRYNSAKQHALHAADSVAAYAATRNIGYVTARLLEFAEEHRVAQIITAADPSDPNVIRQSPALAQQLWLSGQYEAALRFLDAIKKHVSVHPLLTFTRANVLRYLGDMNGAEREYEATLRMSPDMADAHWALATHVNSRPPRARIPRIQAALLRAKNGSIEQAHLCYALFREFDAAGDVDEAWFSLTLGAHVMKQRFIYDSAQEAQRLDAWLEMPYDHSAGKAEEASPSPIFVVGMPRTGTTLLDRILGNHPDVESVGERNDFSAALSEAANFFFRSILNTEPARILAQTNFAQTGQLYLERLGRVARGRRFVLDKNPQNLFNLPLILRSLPSARILCLHREPMDACFSNFKELFQGDAYRYSYDLTNVADHYLRATKWMSYWASKAPTRVTLVSYERVVTETSLEAARLSQFIGLTPHDGLHDIKRNDAPVSTASSSQVREDIHVRGLGAWKRFERHLQPLRERLSQ